ncbi:hypothetical protein [Larkinella sp.]|uniref:hypothetical protein n=1 Tax=Larkinella sp. TaxID=2034517 RepID=UPI003BACE4C2
MKTSIKHTLAMIAFLASTLVAQAQMKVGNNPTSINPGSLIEMESTNKGLLMPRISLTTTTTWGLAGTPTAGMHVYNTNASITSSTTSYPTLAAKIGEYYWDGTGWVALAPAVKTTGVTSFSQSAPGVRVTIPPGGPAGGGYCALPALGSTPPACAVDLSRNAAFSITSPINDVILDYTGNHSVNGHNALVSFFILLYVDKTTPGVFELVDQYYVQESSVGCSGYYLNFKHALKNLPVRNYNVKTYMINWANIGTTTATIGLGAAALSPCGSDDYANQQTIVSVSQ